MQINPLNLKDFYKSSHVAQYPKGTEFVYSNLTARSNKHLPWEQEKDGVVFWGLNGFLQEFLIEEWGKFFKASKEEVVSKYYRRVSKSVGDISVKHIEDLHDLGYLPIKIKAVPEGTFVPIGVPMLTIVNTDKNFGWVTNMLETLLSTEMWKPITTATIAYEYRKLCEQAAEVTCENTEHIPFQCHDFSMRGMSGVHDAAVSGSGHLLSFAGTDTIPAIDYLEEYYGADQDKELVGASVPATEHSVMCMGSKAGEESTVKRLLTEVYPTGIFSCVLDTWDFFKVLTEMLPRLKDTILERDGKFVVRPDSGDPVDIICGYEYLDLGKQDLYYDEEQCNTNELCLDYYIAEPPEVLMINGCYYKVTDWNMADNIFVDSTPIPDAEIKGAIELLWDTFGGRVNDKGYKELHPSIGLIYGDSITLERASEIFKRLESKGFASSNVVFGVGSYTYQYITRDTFGMAVKATWGQISGEPTDIQKDPATDDGTKKSLTGRVCVIQGDKGLEVMDKQTAKEAECGVLKTRFKNSKLVGYDVTLNQVRETLWG